MRGEREGDDDDERYNSEVSTVAVYVSCVRTQIIATLLCLIVLSPDVMAKSRSKKPSLKAALSSAQARFKKRKQAKDAAAQGFDQRIKSGSAKMQNPHRSTIPFKALDNVLLVGEGNFSFAVALLQHPPAPLDHLPPTNIVATAYDTQEECYTKYPDAEQNVRILREQGTQVLFAVDATKLEKTPALKGIVFDRIVWNFPHAGE